jgi:SAM-dependent methyltransferase
MAELDKIGIDLQELRDAIRVEYESVACDPGISHHFHTGRPLAAILGYKDEWLDRIPEKSIESFAGTGSPFRMGELEPGECVVDVGCGAGIDSIISARMVAPGGRVTGVDMIQAMLVKAAAAAEDAGVDNVEFKYGYGEVLPVEDGWADVVISNGVLNLMPDKIGALGEMNRVLKPGGRLQVADILVQKPVSEGAKKRIDLWTV